MAYKFPYDYEEQVKYEAPKLKTNRKRELFLGIKSLKKQIFAF